MNSEAGKPGKNEKTRVSVNFRLLGLPYIEVKGQRWTPPLRKAEALIYYLLAEGPTTRERLSSLFWAERDEEAAQNNLRNTLYLARRALPDLIQADRRLVSIRRGEDSSCDIDEVFRISDPDFAGWEHLCEEFLYGFDLPDCEEFSAWLRESRESHRGNSLAALRLRVSHCYDEEREEELRLSLQALVRLDPFDEDSTLELLELYAKNGETARVVDQYNTYRSRIVDGLGIHPSQRAEEVFRRLILRGRDRMETGKDFFWGRSGEIRDILDALAKERKGPLVTSVHGEAGVGKTALVRQILSLVGAEGDLLLSGTAYEIGRGFKFSPWNELVRSISSRVDLETLGLDPVKASLLSTAFPSLARGRRVAATDEHSALFGDPNPVVLGEILAEVIERVADDHRIFLWLEDLHAFDDFSLELLETITLCLGDTSALFVTSRTGEGKDNRLHFAQTCNRAGTPFLEIDLRPFNPEETYAFGQAMSKGRIPGYLEKETLYRETGGLPLFLTELLKSIGEGAEGESTRGQGLSGIISERVDNLPEDQRRLLEALSIFEDGADLDMLEHLIPGERRTLAGTVESLLKKGLLKETGNAPDLPFRVLFHHEKVRETVYGSLAGFRRTALHRDAAERLQQEYDSRDWDPGLTARLLHHYDLGGLAKKDLDLRLKEMRTHIILNHELFPLLPDDVLLSCSTPFSDRQDTEQRLDQVLDLLHELNRRGSGDPELLRMESAYLELRGGYLIAWGNYREGRQYINRALNLSRRGDFSDIQLRCLQHVCYHCLQTDNASLLAPHAREMLHLAQGLNREPFTGAALRFLGVARQLEGDFATAEIVYRKSIDTFRALGKAGKSYTLGELAAANYIGEVFHWQGRLGEALDTFEECAKRAEESNLFWGCSLFHSNAANVAFDMDDFDRLDRHIDRAVEIFEHGRGGRSGSMLYSFRALREARRGRYSEALQALERGEALCTPIHKKSWTAPHLMAKAYLAEMAQQNPEARRALGPFLGSQPRDYAAECIAMYRAMRVPHRVRALEEHFGITPES